LEPRDWSRVALKSQQKNVFFRSPEQIMVCRRRWRNLAMMLAVGLMAGSAMGAGAVPASPKTPADFEAADAKDLPAMRELIIKMMPTPAVERDRFGAQVASQFTGAGVGINSSRPEVRLNSAILIHDLNTLSTDQPLLLLVKNDDAAVRYWGARGLTEISSRLMASGVGPTTNMIVAGLGARAKVETSGIVQQEIVKALIQYKAFAPLLDALDAISSQMETGMPDTALLETAALGLDFVNKSMGGALAAEKVKGATNAARLASFAAQQLKKNEEGVKTIDPAAKVAPDFAAAVRKVVDTAAKAAGGATGTTYPAPTGDTPAELLMNVNNLFGTPGGRAGKLQTDVKNVPVPPAVKG
jgi:hypothetical protein